MDEFDIASLLSGLGGTDPGGFLASLGITPDDLGEPGGSTAGFPSWSAPAASATIPQMGTTTNYGNDLTSIGPPAASPSLLDQVFGALGKGGLATLLYGAAPALAGLYQSSQTNRATQQQLQAAQQAAQQITSTLTGASPNSNMSLYSPYVSAGQAALARMLALPTSNIAGNFRPLGTGAGFTLGNIARGY